MPLQYALRLTGRDRSAHANRHLGYALALVAGATNAGGYLAVRQYTSHMTGIVSAMADDLVLGERALLLGGLGALLSFLVGAACSALMINYARRRRLHSEYALPLLLEAALLIGFGLMGSRLSQMQGLFVPATVMLLCFIMGLQNAVVTKLSHAEIRTTHLTGMITDIGIEFGKLLYWNRAGPGELPAVRANGARLKLLGALVACFFVGGVIGALGFKQVGYFATVPLALFLLVLAGMPALDDFGAWIAARRRR
ncbi:MAG: YoaK family protein [Burkholderiaceae bacterium]